MNYRTSLDGRPYCNGLQELGDGFFAIVQVHRLQKLQKLSPMAEIAKDFRTGLSACPPSEHSRPYPISLTEPFDRALIFVMHTISRIRMRKLKFIRIKE